MDTLAEATARWLINSGWFDTLNLSQDGGSYQGLVECTATGEWADLDQYIQELVGGGTKGDPLEVGWHWVVITDQGFVEYDGPLSPEKRIEYQATISDAQDNSTY